MSGERYASMRQFRGICGDLCCVSWLSRTFVRTTLASERIDQLSTDSYKVGEIVGGAG